MVDLRKHFPKVIWLRWISRENSRALMARGLDPACSQWGIYICSRIDFIRRDVCHMAMANPIPSHLTDFLQ